MSFPLPAQQDLQQLLISLDEKYVQLDVLSERISFTLPEVQYQDADGKLRLYTSLCTNLSVQLGQYMRLRRLVILPYLKDLFDKDEDGHDCRNCGRNCSIQHAAHIADIREAHTGLHELVEHLQPLSVSSPVGEASNNAMLRSLRVDMMKLEHILNEVLFIEDSALIPMMLDLQRNIGAHE